VSHETIQTNEYRFTLINIDEKQKFEVVAVPLDWTRNGAHFHGDDDRIDTFTVSSLFILKIVSAVSSLKHSLHFENINKE
jgi:hypothetical protein